MTPLGRTSVDGYLGEDPDFLLVKSQSGKLLEAVVNGELITYLVDDVQRVGGRQLSGGNYANPVTPSKASTQDAIAGVDDAKYMTPLKVKDSYTQYGIGLNGLTTSNYTDWNLAPWGFAGFFTISAGAANRPTGIGDNFYSVISSTYGAGIALIIGAVYRFHG